MDEVLRNPVFQIKLSELLGQDWFKIGIYLNIEQRSLESIKSDSINFSKQECKAYEMLKKWFNFDEKPTFEKLKLAILNIPKMDLLKEVEDLASGFFTMSSYLSEGVSKTDLLRLSAELKKYYLKYYGEISELQTLLKTSTNLDLRHRFVDLCIVDAAKTQMDAVFSVERNEFLKKQMSYTPIPYSKVFTQEKSVILVSGIAGIGKTWLLRKCLLDWSNDLIWKNVELVFYLECRRINQYEDISNINDLLSFFYKDIISNFSISFHTTLFIIDGLDEFKYFNELSNPEIKCNYPIVNVLAEIQSYKHLVAGRVYAIDQYQSLYTDRSDKLTIQIMGFNENGITNYVENHVIEENKEIVKATLKESPIAKAMASVPFYLSSMCKIISDSKTINKNSFLTMTDLYANIFLYFLQKHIIKNNKMIYQIMENDSNKKYILNICKIAYELLVENKVIFSKEEFQTFVSGFDKNEGNFFGFIEKIETNLGCYYQFAHLTIMEFCASVYAYNCLSSDEIMTNKKLKSCLSMICGLSNASQNSFIKFLVNLNPLKRSNGKPILLYSILDRLSKSINRFNNINFFYECFYESQSSFTDEIKSIVDELNKRRWWRRWWIKDGWTISIDDGKTSYATSCDNYFVNYYIKSGRKLNWLSVKKNILSDEEKNLLIRCSTNVRIVWFYRPINFEGWKPKDKIEVLTILFFFLITKKDFEENFLPWINLCEELDLSLHDDIDFIKDICEWIRCSNIKKFRIEYRGKDFYNLDELTL
ncbi:NACHT, LRR and PYD domains-containing protein 3-like isoform X1 [Hydra vulgaris]|uniref:NACHT, LRR and PYD domains-containing protein 3-like isoform X1 n=1 Tax=Hydra vulgaris TaxID=6087 RepID=UPI001F5F0EA4|nr:NACHT, LRR and PYD domains-containing protein 3-like isoform X1 [Hydra vulgaris]XP_047131337.1 NACHT, LRR and PYD domains-containing protein 3-like isoform X1 [Hydra vulgaris]XP_047131338.1 NACHT, LRR and PYD domains-containing protein 3-like isoform X1 [Hydra vulgaris]